MIRVFKFSRFLDGSKFRFDVFNKLFVSWLYRKSPKVVFWSYFLIIFICLFLLFLWIRFPSPLLWYKFLFLEKHFSLIDKVFIICFNLPLLIGQSVLTEDLYFIFESIDKIQYSFWLDHHKLRRKEQQHLVISQNPAANIFNYLRYQLGPNNFFVTNFISVKFQSF